MVIGGGHNGWWPRTCSPSEDGACSCSEEQSEPGGAVKSGEMTEPGFTSDLFSVFYPLAVASPAMRILRLEAPRSDLVPLAARRSRTRKRTGAVRCCRSTLDETASRWSPSGPATGEALARLYASGNRPAGRSSTRCCGHSTDSRRARLAHGARPERTVGAQAILAAAGAAARRRALPRRGGAWLLGGNALHADLTPESAGGGLFGWVLCGLGQQYGFPERRAARGS